MAGHIDKYPVTLYLFCTGQVVTGQYYYDKVGQPVLLSGSAKGGKLTLTGGDESIFEGTLTASILTGSWTLGQKKLLLNLVVRKPETPDFIYVWVYGSQKRKHPSKEFPGDLFYESAAVWPSDTSALSAYLKMDILQGLELDAAVPIPIGQALLRDKAAFFKTSQENDQGHGPPFEKHSWLTVFWQDPRMLCLQQTIADYEGQFHETTEELYDCYDLLQQKRMVLQDVLDTDHYGPAVHRLLETIYRKEYHISPVAPLSETLTDGYLPLTENFYLTSTGIGFEYVPGAIASYAAGDITLFVPYNEIRGYLQPDFKRLISPASPHYPQ
jgi:hypothetical protein